MPASTDRAGKQSPAKKAVAWIAGIVIAATAVYFGDVIRGFAQSFIDPVALGEHASGQKPVDVIGPAYLNENGMGRHGFVVAATVDPAAMQSQKTPMGDREKWRASNGAIDVDITGWEVTFTGNREQGVSITRIEAVDIECGEPLTGGLINDQPQEVASKIILKFVVDSPQRPVPAERQPPPGAEGNAVPNFFGSNVITLARGEKQTFVLQGAVAAKHCKWNFTYTVDGTIYPLNRPGGGKFEATARLARNDARYSWVVPGYPDLCGGAAPEILPKIDGKKWSSGDCP